MDPAQSQPKTLLHVAIVILILGVGLACLGGAAILFVVVSSDQAPAPATPAESGPAEPAGPTPAAPVSHGRFSGRVTGPDGGPIRARGARIQVSIAGVSGAGERVGFTPPVAPDGTFDLELVDGIYHPPSAVLLLPSDGKTFRFDLEPTPFDTDDRPSAEGIKRDFAWKLSGLRPGADPDPSNHTRWFGGSIKLGYDFYRNDIKQKVPAPPKGTKVTFTLTPKTPLLDGSTGKTLTFERGYDDSFIALDNGNLPDIPVATYNLAGHETHPDGARRPLLFRKPMAEYVSSLEVKLEPESGGAIGVPMVDFTRPVE